MAGAQRGQRCAAALTVLVTAVAGFFAARYAHGAIVAADAQKAAAQQQELLTLVVDIEQEPAAAERATAPLHGTLLVNTQVQFADELAARNCRLAHAGLHDVRLLFGRGRLAPRRAETKQNYALTVSDQAHYQKRCRG